MKAYWISLAALFAIAAGPAAAQDYGGDEAAATELRRAVERLARAPTDSDALLDAGNAALILRDYDSALGFFTRAESLQPANGRIKAGLATAQLYSENPVEALKLFEQAVALGVPERSIAADRGLAFDLVGDNARAQADYALSSTALSTEDLIIRQAVSFGLAGDQKRADALLNPLLSQNKPAAWRARAFILSANGDTGEATRIVRGFLDARSTSAMTAYLERMGGLTKAQQAAVIHYGHFPADEQVGRDSEAVRAVASRGYVGRAATGTQDQGLIPTGEPLGRRSTASAPQSERSSGAGQSAIAAASVRPTGDGSSTAVPATRSLSASADDILAAGAELPATSASVSANAEQTGLANAAQIPATGDVEPGFASLGDLKIRDAGEETAGTSVASAGPPSVQTTAQTPAASNQTLAASNMPSPVDDQPVLVASADRSAVDRATPEYGPPAGAMTADAGSGVSTSAGAVPSLGEIVRSIQIPSQEKQSNVFAVDLERLALFNASRPLDPEPSPFASAAVPEGAKPLADDESAKVASPVPAPEAAASEAPQPERNWVQIATGADDVMKGEYRRLSRGKTELFKDQKGWTSPWRTQQRLLVGPFDTLGAARKWLDEYEKAGGEGFAWNSEDGTAVAPLP